MGARKNEPLRSMSEQRPQEIQEKRGKSEPRKKVLLGGKIVYGPGGQFSLDCIIRDISEKGARIKLLKGQSIPSTFYLIDIRNGIAYSAELASIRAPEFGLTLLRSFALAGVVDPQFAYLQRLWLSCPH